MHKESPDPAEASRSIRGRVREFYRRLNDQNWEKCFEFVDPVLRESGKVDFEAYAKSLSSFYKKYGPLELHSLQQFNVHPNVQSNRDNRDFAYGVVAFDDREHRSHQVRERWVKASDGRWYTRMVGMV